MHPEECRPDPDGTVDRCGNRPVEVPEDLPYRPIRIGAVIALRGQAMTRMSFAMGWLGAMS
jgi:hypothetical protein